MGLLRSPTRGKPARYRSPRGTDTYLSPTQSASSLSPQSNIQALRIARPCGADQLLLGCSIQRVQPAHHRMATSQTQGFAGQLLGALRATWLQQQDALAVEAGVSQPGLGQAGRWSDQRQPTCVLLLAQFTQDRRQQAQAASSCTAKRQFTERLRFGAPRGLDRLLEDRRKGLGHEGLEQRQLCVLWGVHELHGASFSGE